ncbi:uncharacterized protein LOC116345616 [Contarinia nasturtii]|uniref:uncharacterized protein LOC116345616 n=1 Tax=Contarinia nasturtii TaxID=265458 RepID=UPI0012D428C8|nr:uncharacterized protein LOC116345616 [Contarinia nasturtii]
MNRVSKLSFTGFSRYLLSVKNVRNVVPVRYFKKKSESDAIKSDKPMDFFGTSAERVRVTPAPPERPKYSAEIVTISLASFLVYFCILREENDIDEALGRDLYDYFGEEGSRLKKAYDYNIEHGLPTAEILDRLREIGAPVPPRK